MICSEISDGFVRNVADYAEIGEIVKAEVIEYDEVNRRLKLSIKNDKCVKRNKKNRPIKETKTGFSGLSKQLDAWIKDKEKEIEYQDYNKYRIDPVESFRVRLKTDLDIPQ